MVHRISRDSLFIIEVVMRRFAVVGCLLAAFVFAWAAPDSESLKTPAKAVVAKQGMVVCVSPDAAKVGIDILKKQGTAVDAAVAVALAMAVTHPAAGNIGGGGFMMILPAPGQEPTCIDYRETAPASAAVDMFAKVADSYSPRSVGIPGTVRGLQLAHQKYGKLPWRDVAMPAVQLAEQGFAITPALASSLNAVLADAHTSEAFRRTFGPKSGTAWKAGDRLAQPDLGKSLRLIATNGPDAFYQGELADRLATQMKKTGGLITREDLAGYRAVQRTPVHGTYRGFDVYGAPPPSSGGVTLVQMLNMLETFEVTKHPRFSPQTLHLMTEVMRRGFADRARYLGDPGFTKIPAHLTTKEYAKELARTIDPKAATPSEKLNTSIPLAPEGDSTTHFSIIDAQGMAVSNTYTLEESYGSRIVVEGAGYLLNNEMLDFNRRPGYTDRKGAIGTLPNQVAPGKRMLSSQTPTLILRDGKAYLITGSPGGRTILNTVFNVVVNVLDYEMDVQAAVDAPRTHMAWFPDELKFEGMKAHPETVTQLRAMGHLVKPTKQGDAHSIWIDPKTGLYHGAADRRIDGAAIGY